MTKKIFALVMVVSVFGAIFASGCKKDDAAGDTAATATTAGKADTAGSTAATAGDTAGKS